jgi:hypothetical protein
MVKFLSFKDFVAEATLSGQMMPNINFAPNLAFAPMAENPQPDAGEQDHLNMRTKMKKKIPKKKKNEER